MGPLRTCDITALHDDRKAKGDDVGENKSSLQRTFAYFHREGNSCHTMAEPGDKDHVTKLYSVITTPLSQMGDFGIGFGLYFSTLRSVAVLCFLLGLLNLPKMFYFASDAYSGTKSGVTGLLKTSAICTDTEWVPCPTCTPDQFVTFPAVYPTVRSLFLNQRFVSVEGGNWLNVTDHVSYDDDYIYFVDTDFWSTTFGGYNTTPAVDCFSSLDGFCYVNLTDYSDVVGDSELQPISGGFALRNNCDGATLRQGFVNYASLFVLIIGSIFLRHEQSD